MSTVILSKQKAQSRVETRPVTGNEDSGLSRVIGRAFVYLVLSLFAILFTMPFLWLVSNSLKNAEHAFDANWIPQPIEWGNYQRVFEEIPLLLMARNSIFSPLWAFYP